MNGGIDINQAILTDFSNGDEAAFRQVFDLLYRPLCFFAGKFTGQKEEAEDMAAQAFHKLWLRREGFDALPAIRSFLYTTVKNQCLDLIKHKAVVSHAHQQLATSPEAADSFAESHRMQAELLELIFGQIAKLPEKYRLVLEMSFKEELTVPEIAQRTNKAENHVRADRSRALAMLRASLKDQHLLEAALVLWSIYEAGHFYR
ncbi:sigma-70 family RNA polymerase sigma factor [Chitinophaga pollutisoli]|uniref:Sigma-70 family RNA polymerase sigma factor n=1 Tax=Chitinophaga pollutisoli TaxID=3133966 RepID=A0ABZ2YW33_9BACT